MRSLRLSATPSTNAACGQSPSAAWASAAELVLISRPHRSSSPSKVPMHARKVARPSAGAPSLIRQSARTHRA